MTDADIKYLESIPVNLGEFNSLEHELSNLSEEFMENIEKNLAVYGLTHDFMGGKPCGWNVITPGMFEVQHHDFSVNPHTDDIIHYFCLVPYWIEQKSEATAYSLNPFLNFFDPKGKKMREAFVVGEPIVFNPRRLHSLDYYGREVKLMLFSVGRPPKKSVKKVSDEVKE